jgi:hypothetical protein
MIVHEIAETAGVTPETVKNAIRAKWPEKMKKGKITHLGYHEAIEIMGDIRKKGFIAPANNLHALTNNLHAEKLPAGVQLREMRLIYGPEEAGRRLDMIMGYKAAPELLALDAPTSGDLGRLSKAAYAVEMRERAKVKAQEEADKLQGKLFKAK